MSRYTPLAEWLAAESGDQLALSFHEIEALIGKPLPASAKSYPAFWARGNLTGRVIAEVGWRASLEITNARVRFLRIGSILPRSPKRAHGQFRVELPEPDFVLIGCVKGKREGRHRASELYPSALFTGRRARAEETTKPWYVLSSKYGLLHPDEIIETYDVALKELPVSARHDWSRRVLEQLDTRLGRLARKVVEIHAGGQYRDFGLAEGLKARGARVVVPLEHLTRGQQLAWYADRYGSRIVSELMPSPEIPAKNSALTGDPNRIVAELTASFYQGSLDLSRRPGAPTPGWAAMPECRAVSVLQKAGAEKRSVRLFLTLVAALDRARDADRLFDNAAQLYLRDPWTFEPAEVTRRSFRELREALAVTGVSQRHLPDTAAWRAIAESLVAPDCPEAIRQVVEEGRGEVGAILEGVRSFGAAQQPLFPYLSGPKVALLWVRLLVEPGGASIRNIAKLPVAVDVQVRKVTEYLGLADTEKLSLEEARPIIQTAWEAGAAVATGPKHLAGTASAVDPAIWFFGKWGCTFCEGARRKMAISDLCTQCRYRP